MMRLTLLCSATGDSRRRARFPDDEPLDAAGIAAALALDVKRADRVLVSPALRARQTAEALGLAGAVDERLREIDYGTWAGRELGEVAASEPEAMAAWLADPNAAPHGGESLAALFERAGAFLAERLNESGHVLAITHAEPMRAMAAVALGAPHGAFWRIDVAPLTRLILTSDGKRWNLRALVESKGEVER